MTPKPIPVTLVIQPTANIEAAARVSAAEMQNARIIVSLEHPGHDNQKAFGFLMWISDANPKGEPIEGTCIVNTVTEFTDHVIELAAEAMAHFIIVRGDLPSDLKPYDN